MQDGRVVLTPDGEQEGDLVVVVPSIIHKKHGSAKLTIPIDILDRASLVRLHLLDMGKFSARSTS